MEQLDFYWQSVPIGKENRVSYSELCDLWGVNRRMVRNILHRLSGMDTNDPYVLIRSSSLRGFYRTDDLAEIERYRQEVMNRARHTFCPLRKINKLLGENPDQLSIEL